MMDERRVGIKFDEINTLLDSVARSEMDTNQKLRRAFLLFGELKVMNQELHVLIAMLQAENLAMKQELAQYNPAPRVSWYKKLKRMVTQ